MIKNYYEINCDICNEKLTLYNIQIGSIYERLRSRKWAVSRDRLATFCPACRKKVCSVGRNGNKKLLPFVLRARNEIKKIYEDDERKQREEYEREYYEFLKNNEY